MVGWQEGHLSDKNPVPLIPRGALPVEAEVEDPRANWLTQVHPEERSLTGSSNSIKSNS